VSLNRNPSEVTRMTSRPEAPSAGAPEVPPPAAPPHAARHTIVIVLQILAALAVIAGGVVLAVYLVATGPQAKQKRPEARARLIDVEQVAFGRQRTVVHAMGTVCPARSVELHPRVGGEVIEVASEFLPGGRFRKDERLLRIDPEDYALAVEQRELALKQAQLAAEQCALAIEQKQSTVARTEGELKLEIGQQAIARRDFELFGETVSDGEKELVLRQPQMQTVQAAAQAARAALKEAEAVRKAAETAAEEAGSALRRAKLDIERTVIQAPFNAVVRTRGVDLGATVTTATPLATLVGTDEYWAEVAVPQDQLKWVRIPQAKGEPGSAVRVYNEAAWGADRFRAGRVLRLAGDLEEQGRMARLLVSIDDPLAQAEANRGQPVLLIGSYVRVEIDGLEIESAASVSRSLLRDGDRIWVMGPDDRLQIRPVTIAFRSRDDVLVTGGLEPSDRLVVTDLAAPVEGMPLRLREAADTDAPPASTGRLGDPPAAAEGLPR
jgi:hypothetical protein